VREGPAGKAKAEDALTRQKERPDVAVLARKKTPGAQCRGWGRRPGRRQTREPKPIEPGNPKQEGRGGETSEGPPDVQVVQWY